jgi:DNA-binding NarL/FixJ family response regulator
VFAQVGMSLPELAICAEHADEQIAWKISTLGKRVFLKSFKGQRLQVLQAEVLPKARIVVLTTFDGDEGIYRGMRAGAKSYLLKDVRREELFQCIREVHAGKTFVPPAIAAKLAERLPGDELSPRELEVLRLLAEGKPNKLIGAAMSIAEVTVKSHVQGVFRKLNVLSRTEAIAVATRRGLLRV